MKVFHHNGDLKSMEVRDSLGRIPIKNPRYFPPVKSYRDKDILCFNDADIDSTKSNLQINGYSKLFNEKKDLLFDGVLKNGCAWDGRFYVFNKDGFLMKVEIWKNGRYHSDGQL